MPSNTIYYRIVEIDDKGNYKSLFHGTNGSRILEKRKWLKANIKNVRDGSRKQSTEYVSGFHVLPTKEECEQFFHKRFKIKENRIIIPCRAKALKKKKHSPSNILLAEEIYII